VLMQVVRGGPGCPAPMKQRQYLEGLNMWSLLKKDYVP
jgi:hypothetical protein